LGVVGVASHPHVAQKPPLEFLFLKNKKTLKLKTTNFFSIYTPVVLISTKNGTLVL